MSGIQTLYFGIIAASGNSLNIIADTANFNLRTALLANGWNGTSPVIASINIASGVAVYSNSTSSPAFDTGAALPAGSHITLINNGIIVGKGGNGAAGYTANGGAGGKAMNISTAIDINNLGIIGGGGGGGGTGGMGLDSGGYYAYNTGGCGGGGIGFGYGGHNSSPPVQGRAGGDGTATSAGAGGGPSTTFGGGYGGSGGGYGQAGQAGQLVNSSRTLGGAAGAAITGNSLITWLNTGSVYGSVS
jgi:hypothetical protein